MLAWNEGCVTEEGEREGRSRTTAVTDGRGIAVHRDSSFEVCPFQELELDRPVGANKGRPEPSRTGCVKRSSSSSKCAACSCVARVAPPTPMSPYV